MPTPDLCRLIKGPIESGVYKIRSNKTKQYIQFGIGKSCQQRMKSLYPEPYGTGKRNNFRKRDYILQEWHSLEFRTLSTTSREVAKLIEDFIKNKRNHLFNT
jgi:hypothetical protein